MDLLLLSWRQVTKAGVSLAHAFEAAAGARAAADSFRGRRRPPCLCRRAPPGPWAARQRPPPARQAGARRSTAPALGLAESAFRRVCSAGFAAPGMMSESLAVEPARACSLSLSSSALVPAVVPAALHHMQALAAVLSHLCITQHTCRAHAHAGIAMCLSTVLPSACSPLAVMHKNAHLTFEPNLSPSHARRPACRPAAATARARLRRMSAAAAATPRPPSGARSSGSASARRPRGAALCSCMCGSTACTAARRTRRADQHPLRPAPARSEVRQGMPAGLHRLQGSVSAWRADRLASMQGGPAQGGRLLTGCCHLLVGRTVSERAAGAHIADM